MNQAATDGITAIKMIQPETKVKPAAREKSIKKRMNYVRKLIKIKKRQQKKDKRR